MPAHVWRTKTLKNIRSLFRQLQLKLTSGRDFIFFILRSARPEDLLLTADVGTCTWCNIVLRHNLQERIPGNIQSVLSPNLIHYGLSRIDDVLIIQLVLLENIFCLSVLKAVFCCLLKISSGLRCSLGFLLSIVKICFSFLEKLSRDLFMYSRQQKDETNLWRRLSLISRSVVFSMPIVEGDPQGACQAEYRCRYGLCQLHDDGLGFGRSKRSRSLQTAKMARFLSIHA